MRQCHRGAAQHDFPTHEIPSAFRILSSRSHAVNHLTNIYGDDVAVLDLNERTIVATVPVDAGPNGISFTPLLPAQAPAPQVSLPMPHNDDANMPAMQH